jgi:glycosyltransferase involved in cell wall biosynthesis
MLDKGVKVYSLGRKVGHFTPFRYLRLNMIMHSIRPDVIHCHIPDQARLLFFIPKSKLQLTLHDVNKELKDVPLYGKTYSISRSVQKDLEERKGIKSRIIYNGIDLDGIQVKKWKAADTFHMVVLGRLVHEKKGQDIFIRALAHLIHNEGKKNLRATIIGDGDSRSYLEKLAEDLAVSDQLTFAGARERPYIQKHLKDFDLLVQPSRYEGFGITVIEAMAAGIPVLVSDVDGPMEIIREGEYGSYFSSGDETDLARKITEIMEQSVKPGFPEQLERARKYVHQMFSIKSTSDNYCESYFNN